MARKTRSASPKTRGADATTGTASGHDEPGLVEDVTASETEEVHDDNDLVRMRVDPVWRRRMNARRKLEAYWEEKRLRAMIGDVFEDESYSIE